MKEFAPGKINLALRVGKRRADGFHDVDMVMQSISLADTITLEEAPTLTLTIDSSALPCDERNLAYQAALVFEKWTKIKPAVHIHIQKRIYLAAGLAGGSADAAGVLRILNRYYGKPLSRGQLEEAAAEIGSDVPFCIAGGTQRALGRGELMRPLPPSPTLWMVLAKPAGPRGFDGRGLSRLGRRKGPERNGYRCLCGRTRAPRHEGPSFCAQ